MMDHETKSLNRLWLDFKNALQDGIDRYVPKKTISSKDPPPGLPRTLNAIHVKGTACIKNIKNGPVEIGRNLLL